MRVSYYIHNENFEDEYILKILLLLAGFRICRSPNPETANLHYGSPAQFGSSPGIIKSSSRVFSAAIIEKLISDAPSGKVIEFDMISSAKAILTDSVNEDSVPGDYDIHDRLKFASGSEAMKYLRTAPVINYYVKFLREWIRTYLEIEPEPFFPNGKLCAIGLSHDVDRPVKRQFLREFKIPGRWNLKQKAYHVLRYANAMRHRRSFEKGYDGHIKTLIEEESKYSFKSTFFFCSQNMYSTYGTIYDVPYDIKWPEVKQCVKWVNEAGFETGLHASYNSYENAIRLKQEKQKLEDISGKEVKGLRHHYWHMGTKPFKTLENHSEAGFLYDTSFAFNEHIGFRLSIASGFYALIPGAGSFINCMEIPVLAMDGNFDYRKTDAIKKIESEMTKYIKKLKTAGGVGVLDWHTDTAVPVNKRNLVSAHVYLRILEILAADKDIWVTNLEDIYSHYEKRLSTIKNSPEAA